jgi:hypothetical protein
MDHRTWLGRDVDEGDAGRTRQNSGPIERALENSRFIMAVPVVLLFLASVGAFVYAIALFVDSTRRIVDHPFPIGKNVGYFVVLIDILLVGATLLIAAFGFYELFVARDHPRPGHTLLPGWLSSDVGVGRRPARAHRPRRTRTYAGVSDVTARSTMLWPLVFALGIAACQGASTPSVVSPPRSPSTIGAPNMSWPVALRTAAITVTPSHGLSEGQQVMVSVRGFPPGVKLFVSECATPRDANWAGCGPQIAEQSFGLTDDAGNGSVLFTVHSSAATMVNDNVLVPCNGECVVVAHPDVEERVFVLSPIAFADP